MSTSGVKVRSLRGGGGGRNTAARCDVHNAELDIAELQHTNVHARRRGVLFT